MSVVGVDSNSLTYLIDAVEDGYIPRDNVKGADPERVAMFRLFCYADISLWISPTVKAESSRISDPWRRDRHDVWTGNHLEDFAPPTPRQELEKRARELTRWHSELNDCRIVAEAESVGTVALLTYDANLVNHLQSHTRLSLVTPSKFFATLGILPGAATLRTPRSDNPLSRETWWHV